MKGKDREKEYNNLQNCNLAVVSIGFEFIKVKLWIN